MTGHFGSDILIVALVVGWAFGCWVSYRSGVNSGRAAERSRVRAILLDIMMNSTSPMAKHSASLLGERF